MEKVETCKFRDLRGVQVLILFKGAKAMKVQIGFLLAILLGSSQLLAAEESGNPEQNAMSSDNAAQSQPLEEASSDAQNNVAEQTGFSSGSVMRSVFTTQIADREPVDKIQELDNDNQEVYYFTELRDMEGQTARHRWQYNGEVMAEVEFNVKGPRWRVWSSKRFVPDWTGEWTVSVVNAADEVIAEDSFEYVADKTSDMPAEDSAATQNNTGMEESSPNTQ
jgi:hypothetical protein